MLFEWSHFRTAGALMVVTEGKLHLQEDRRGWGFGLEGGSASTGRHINGEVTAIDLQTPVVEI